MNVLNTWYARGVDAVGAEPSWKRDWRWICLWSAVSYIAVAALRLSFAGRWDHPELWVGSERILSTHDAYFWLAKAKGLGELSGYLLARLAAGLHGWFGVSYGDIGFWMPALMGALVGVVCCLWGWLIGGRHAGIFAGLAGALTPGFFYRSRLGYFDTDMFTLLMPLVVTWLLAFWLRFHLRSAWFGRGGTPEAAVPSLWMAFCFGVAMRIAIQWHDDILNVTIMYLLFAAGVLLVGGARGRRANGFLGLCAMLLLAFPGEGNGHLFIVPLTQLPFGGFPSTYWESMGWGGLVALILCLFANGPRMRPAVMDNFWFAFALFALLVFGLHLVQ
ncbi:STT3 domain-containing protein, partial [Pseudodesulfovibrio sp.]|uniref:STT3 domain-containing protein n=1 Tax=Pseudodesulfovibrio sp. TaxID=2035812 RepID=UPI0026236349